MTPEQKTLIEAEAEKYTEDPFRTRYKDKLLIDTAYNSFIKGAQFALSIAHQWIKIEPGCKMPDKGERVLIFQSWGAMNIGYVNVNGDWCLASNGTLAMNCTHYQPLPLTPTQ